jgi:hypothetical protein
MRVRWFLLGAAVGAWGAVRALKHIERAKTALTPAHLAKQGASTLADLLEAGGARLGAH